MPAVLVNGVPETPYIWDKSLPYLNLYSTDIFTLPIPEFGTAEPKGWGASVGEYVDWLSDRIAEIGRPVDLVGHDWGGNLTTMLAARRPELLRTWASDGCGDQTSGTSSRRPGELRSRERREWARCSRQLSPNELQIMRLAASLAHG